jgi:hypothetical protein
MNPRSPFRIRECSAADAEILSKLIVGPFSPTTIRMEKTL